jgi:hypothetical protein
MRHVLLKRQWGECRIRAPVAYVLKRQWGECCIRARVAYVLKRQWGAPAAYFSLLLTYVHHVTPYLSFLTTYLSFPRTECVSRASLAHRQRQFLVAHAQNSFCKRFHDHSSARKMTASLTYEMLGMFYHPFRPKNLLGDLRARCEHMCRRGWGRECSVTELVWTHLAEHHS